MNRTTAGMIAAWAALLAGCAPGAASPATLNPVAAAPPLRAAPPVEQIGRMHIAIDRALALHRAGRRVLMVFDLDSTLLRNSRREPDITGLRSQDADQFRGTERAVIYLSRLVPMEPDMAAEVARLGAGGVASLVLTARGADMRDMTLRELAENGLDFSAAPECGPPLCVRRGMVRAADVAAAAAQVLGPAEAARLELTRGRDITMADGVMTAAGLDKGALVRLVLASLTPRFDAVVFVDDAEKNTASMARAAQGMAIPVAIFHYRGPARPAADDPRSRAEVEADWQAARQAVCKALAPRWCE